MIKIEQIKNFFSAEINENPLFKKYMLKEYIQLLILDYLSTTAYIKKIVFIGGTNLRLIKKIDRFSEDLDFDCKNLSKSQFLEMAKSILKFLQRSGFEVQMKVDDNEKLSAFRCNIFFPEFLYNLGLSAHQEERFLIKIESQDQEVSYKPGLVNIMGCGLFFPFPVPSDGVLCAMKIAAMLSRQKGRDFYDVIFLLSQAKPDFKFLSEKCNIKNLDELKESVYTMLEKVDLAKKVQDFKHLVFNQRSSERILHFREFIDAL